MPVFPPHEILVGTDLTDTSRAAVLFAGLLHKQFGAPLHLLHAHHFDLPPYFLADQFQDLVREIRESARSAADYLRSQSRELLGFEAEVSVTDGRPVDAILQAAKQPDVDLLVIGTHGRQGADRFWLGSVAEGVLRRSEIPVLVVRCTAAPRRFEKILCPVNSTDVSRKALEYAAAIAGEADSSLTVIHVIEPGAPPPDCTLVPEAIRSQCTINQFTCHGDAAFAILSAAQKTSPDLIVLGAEHKSSPFGPLFSSTTERVVRRTETPVAVVPRPGA